MTNHVIHYLYRHALFVPVLWPAMTDINRTTYFSITPGNATLRKGNASKT